MSGLETSLLRLATAGSVDDGKSTLVGRLLHDSKNVLADQLDALERLSRERGLTSTDLALLTDGLRAEREQGITIDVAYRYFSTGLRSFILADCPGHVQYTRNTVTGASTADVLVVLVDIRSGVQDQTRRHLAVGALLRVPHVVVAVNKIDLVDYDGDRFAEVADEVARTCAALGITSVHTIPVSALVGDNVVERSERTPYYDGPSLLDLLGELPGGEQTTHEAFRLPVQYVLRPQQAARDPKYVEYRGLAGRVSAGTVSRGDEVVVLPGGQRTTIAGIDTATGELESARTGQSVSLRLADDLDVTRGDLIAAAEGAPEAVRETDAMVCWLAEVPLRKGQRVLFKHGSNTVQGMVTELHGRLDLGSLTAERVEAFDLNDIGRISLRLGAPVPVEDYGRSRTGGAFVLIDPQSGGTLAAGMVRRERRDGSLAVPSLTIEWEI
ncbi:sulfate adenylyltransferase subunit 1 [Propionibacteriaceae bacterium Y2011]